MIKKQKNAANSFLTPTSRYVYVFTVIFYAVSIHRAYSEKIYTVRCITIKNRTENHSSKTGFCIEMHHEVGPKVSFLGAQQLLRECATFRFDILCRSASGEVGESGTMSINDARLLMADFQKRLSEVTTFLGVAEIVDLVVDWSASGPQKARS